MIGKLGKVEEEKAGMYGMMGPAPLSGQIGYR